MPSTITAKFDTQREAELAVERRVQEFEIERTDIFVEPEGPENSAGGQPAGPSTEAGSPTTDDLPDAALEGRIIVSADVQDDNNADLVRSAVAEFDGVAEEK